MLNRNIAICLVLASLLAVSMLTACQTPAGRSAGEVIDDTSITTVVKAKLFDESILRGFAISVTTFEGEVTLTGAVDNSGQRDRAAILADLEIGGHNTYFVTHCYYSIFL